MLSYMSLIKLSRVKQRCWLCSLQIHLEAMQLLISTAFMLIVSAYNQPQSTLHHMKKRNARLQEKTEGNLQAPENLVYPSGAQELLI